MNEVASGVWHIPLMPRDAINAYVIGDVLVDAGTRGAGRRLAGRLAGRGITAHAATHAHNDHVGGSKAVCEALGVPFWCPAGDADDAARGRPTPPPTWLARNVIAPLGGWPGIEAQRRLVEGDEVAGFQVLDAPGHSPGHVVFWRASDRVLVGGDVFFNIRNLLTAPPGLREPVGTFTVDPQRNRASMRRLAELEPELALFGHGPPVRDAAAKLHEVVATLPPAD